MWGPKVRSHTKRTPQLRSRDSVLNICIPLTHCSQTLQTECSVAFPWQKWSRERSDAIPTLSILLVLYKVK